MSPNPIEALIGQFSGFIVQEDITEHQWEMVATEFGVHSTAKGIQRFYRSWHWGDEDRRRRTLHFLRAVANENEETALGIMRRLYSIVDGADAEQLQEFPALEALENQDIDMASVGVPQIPIHTDLFLDIENIPGTFYPELVDHINQCYRLGIYDASLILTRKLLENLLIDVLRSQYGTDRINLYYRPNRGRFQGFNDLIENFEDNLDDFQHLSDALDTDFIQELNSFRENANAGAHSIETNMNQEDMEVYRDQARHTAQVLFRLKGNL